MEDHLTSSIGRAALAAWLGLALGLTGEFVCESRALAEVLRPSEGESLSAVVARAADGDVVEVPPGRWQGPVVLERSVTLRGAGGVIDGGHHGIVVRVDAPDARVEGLRIERSGTDLTYFHACIWTGPRALRVRVERNDLRECAFGVYVQESHAARVTHNVVAGRRDLRVVDRGNGIHLFGARRVLVANNEVSGTRDGIFVSATHDSTIAENRFRDVRYGVHYMWSHGNRITKNVVSESLAGFALMQSRDLIVEDNVAYANARAGFLLRDGEDNRLARNLSVNNGLGLFVYNSQRERLENNTFAYNAVGAKIWGALVTDAAFVTNDFVGNHEPVLYVGRRDMSWGTAERGNHFSEYVGWDQDGDGEGERPYRVNSFISRLVHEHPAAALLLRSPALELLAHLEARMPVLRTATITDHRPRVRSVASVARLRVLADETPRRRGAPSDRGDYGH